MKTSVSVYQFRDAFQKMDRYNHFSYEGYEALFDWLEDLDEDTGQETELDVIALCCDFSEYEDLEELQNNYRDIESMEDLKDHTTVIPIDNTDRLIIQNF